MTNTDLKEIHIDYNTIADSVKEVIPEIFSYGIDAIAIEVNGGQMLGMHIAHLLKLPYSFITYSPVTKEPIWLGSEVREERILVVSAYNNTNALRIKKFLEDRNKKPFFINVYIDSSTQLEPDFALYDNRGKQQVVVLPWQSNFKPPLVYKNTTLDTNLTTTEEVLEKVKTKGLLKGKTSWYISKSKLSFFSIGIDDILTVTDTGVYSEKRLEGRLLVNKVLQETSESNIKNIVVMDTTIAIVLSLLLKEIKVHALVEDTLVCIDAEEVKTK